MGATMSGHGRPFEAGSGASGLRPHPGALSRLTVALTIALATTLLVPSSAWAVPVPWKNCGRPTDHLRVSKVDASVWPPQRGQPITVSTSGTLDETVTALRTSLAVSVDGMPVVAVDTPALPVRPAIGAGPFTRTVTFTVPRWIPSGLVVGVRVAARDQNDQGILCVDLTVSIK